MVSVSKVTDTSCLAVLVNRSARQILEFFIDNALLSSLLDCIHLLCQLSCYKIHIIQKICISHVHKRHIIEDDSLIPVAQGPLIAFN